MKKTLWLSFIALLLLPLACNEPVAVVDDDGENPYIPLVLSTKQMGYVATGNAFAYDFISRVDKYAASEAQDEWFISPLSLQIALGMLINGAQGETAGEICEMLGYGPDEVEEVNKWCRMMLSELPKLDKKTELGLADAIFYNKYVTLKPSYLNTVKSVYDAEIRALDFGDVEASLKAINGWCSEKTRGMVPEVLDNVDPRDLAYLINALYFKSEWQEQFPKSSTAGEPFVREDGKEVNVKMMKLTEKKLGYGESDAFQAINLPYGNGAFTMTVVLPKKGHTVSEVAALLAGQPALLTTTATVDLWLPRFEMKYHIELNAILEAMGMQLAFDSAMADFGAMCDQTCWVDFVQQDTAITVDEEGTEAAAVTVIGIKRATSVSTPNIVFHADHPFLFLITETSTRAVLFAGKYSGN